ncbi:hypothetical protein B1748_26615 [Paenibacillus sp. MY03]|nr:hypothetical protein B1748_26615 [Paenibacillus sp. MY03]
MNIPVISKFKKFGFQNREDWMKLETEERSVAELREHRKFRLSSSFDVEYTPWYASLWKADFLNILVRIYL